MGPRLIETGLLTACWLYDAEHSVDSDAPKRESVVRRVLRNLALAVVITLGLAGCASFGDSSETINDLPDVSFYKNDELVALGKTEFRGKNYGKSYALFKRAVEVFPRDPDAWLGLAASADQIGRFDTSDLAYRNLQSMIGNRPEYYNNLGYSYLLRGNLQLARANFLKAYELDPANPTTANNLQLLANSGNLAKRAP